MAISAAIKKAGRSLLSCGVKQTLQRNDVLCLRAFLALGYGEFHLLAFGQSFEAGAGDCAEMRENVRAVWLLDETKTFRFIKPFNGAGYFVRHVMYLYIKIKKAPRGAVVLKHKLCWMLPIGVKLGVNLDL